MTLVLRRIPRRLLVFQRETKNEIRGGRGSVTNHFFKVKRILKSAGGGGGGRGVWSKIGTFSQFEKHDSTQSIV